MAPTAREHQPREDHAKPSHHERHRARRPDAPARAWSGADGGLSVADRPVHFSPLMLLDKFAELSKPRSSLTGLRSRLFARTDRLPFIAPSELGSMTEEILVSEVYRA